MHELHLASLDLNLIVALDALLEERSVTRAAARIGITQSAMSHALARLRALTGDELLVRSSKGMVPTVRAGELGPPIRRALFEVSHALAKPPPFEPKTARLRVAIATSDYVEIVLLPKLVERLSVAAPGIDLRISAMRDVGAPLASGEIDLALAPPFTNAEGGAVLHRKLFDERFVCVARKGHPLAGRTLTPARFAAASHVLIAPGEKERGFVDDALARLGLERRVAVMVPHALIAPHLVAASDLLLTVAERVANLLAKPLGLVTMKPPSELRLAGFTIAAMWHERTQNDPAHRWVREQIVEIAKSR